MSFQDPNPPNEIYAGAGGGVSGNNSFGWNVAANEIQSFTGAGFTITVNMAGLTDLSVAFSLRAAGSAVEGLVPASFKSIEYFDVVSSAWVSTGVTSPSWATGSNNYSRYSVSFSDLDEIEGQPDVQIRFTLADTSVIPAGGTASSIRIDNLV